MFERIVKATEKLPMHIKVILAEKTEKVTFANGYFEILVSKDDSVFENEVEPFYRLCKELSKELNLKGSTLIFDDKRFSYMLLYKCKENNRIIRKRSRSKRILSKTANMVKGIAPEELDLEILEFLNSLSEAGIRIPAKHVVKEEILQEIIHSEKDFDYVTFKHRKHEAKIQFNDRGFDTLRIDVEEFIPL